MVGCTDLEILSLPASLQSVGILDIGSNRKPYARDAVYGLVSLKEIKISEENALFSVYDNALYSDNYENLWLMPRAKKWQYTIPGTVKEIEVNAFAGAHKLTALTIPSSVKNAGINITGCSLLKKVIFKEGVRSIYMYGSAETDFYGFNGFMEKIQIKKVHLPSTLNNITIENINNDTIFYAYNNKDIYTTWYSEDDAHSIKLISTKNYLTSQGYGYKSLGTVH